MHQDLLEFPVQKRSATLEEHALSAFSLCKAKRDSCYTSQK